MTHVLFWDIDGTLLSTARAGVFALEDAAREVCGGAPDFSSLVTDGLTDAEVASLSIETCGAAAAPEMVTAFLRAYERHLPARLGLRRGRVLEGVIEVLDHLAERPGVTSLLLTGNTRSGAAAKLAHYGLDHYFDDGAFCEDGDDRETIARRAMDLARARAREGETGELRADHVVVIGDTPHDVRCGRQIGARTVAVASGTYREDDLRACGPWMTLPCLPAPAVFVRRLGLDSSAASSARLTAGEGRPPSRAPSSTGL